MLEHIIIPIIVMFSFFQVSQYQNNCAIQESNSVTEEMGSRGETYDATQGATRTETDTRVQKIESKVSRMQEKISRLEQEKEAQAANSNNQAVCLQQKNTQFGA